MSTEREKLQKRVEQISGRILERTVEFNPSKQAQSGRVSGRFRIKKPTGENYFKNTGRLELFRAMDRLKEAK